MRGGGREGAGINDPVKPRVRFAYPEVGMHLAMGGWWPGPALFHAAHIPRRALDVEFAIGLDLRIPILLTASRPRCMDGCRAS